MASGTGKRFEDAEYRQICSEKTLQSNSKGFFMDFTDFVVEEVGNKWIHKIFGSLRTDEERIKVLYSSKETSSILENFLINVQEVYRSKSGQVSYKKRLEAEHLLKEKQFEKALILFSQSVMRAPRTGEDKQFDSGLSLALALWGRSQVFMKLDNHSKALIDIQQALKESLPENFKAQAFWNMANCYKVLGEENRAAVSFKLAENLLQDNPEKLAQLSLDKQQEYPKINKTVTKFTCEKPQLNGTTNKCLPDASEKLTVKSSKNMGRYIVANQNIGIGETLVAESPYVACLLPEMFGTHCHHCLKRLEAPFGCKDCSSVAFCSVDCRDEAMSTYHQYECKYLDLLIGSGMSVLGHTALRIITQNGLQKCLQVYKNRENERIYKLCTNSDLRKPEDFLQRTIMAAFLLRFLQKSGFFGNTDTSRVFPTDTEYQLGEMLLFNLQMLQFNAHEIYETRRNVKSDQNMPKVVYIGVGVYQTASLFNHDCFLALSRHFDGKNIVLTSVRPLKANEIVPENYGPVFTRKTLAERQRSLSSRYWFDCKCLACEQDWPCLNQGLENVSKRIKCPTDSCKQVLTIPEKRQTLQCSKCKKNANLSKILAMLKWCKKQYLYAFELLDKAQIQEAIDVLQKALDTFYKISLPPNKETQLAEEMLAICYAHFGNYWEK